MATSTFNAHEMAAWYARQHLKTDPGLKAVYYLPSGADERELRVVEVNELIGERTDDALEPIDFGVDTGNEGEHKLFVLDVTPDQWNRIQSGNLPLPQGWSLEHLVPFE